VGVPNINLLYLMTFCVISCVIFIYHEIHVSRYGSSAITSTTGGSGGSTGSTSQMYSKKEVLKPSSDNKASGKSIVGKPGIGKIGKSSPTVSKTKKEITKAEKSKPTRQQTQQKVNDREEEEEEDEEEEEEERKDITSMKGRDSEGNAFDDAKDNGTGVHPVAEWHHEGEQKERKGKLICNGTPLDSEVIYWKTVPGDDIYESPITPHHGYDVLSIVACKMLVYSVRFVFAEFIMIDTCHLSMITAAGIMCECRWSV
jgi:hypothetical protein